MRIFNSSDVVYMMVPTYPNDALVYLLKRYIHTKLVAGFHGQIRSDRLFDVAYFPVFKHALRAFDAYHTLNRQTCLLLNQLGYKSVYHIPNGVDSKRFQICDPPEKSKTFNVLYVGWLTELKGIKTVLQIARLLNKYGLREIKLMVCGSGPLEPLIKEASQNYNNIEHFDYVPPECIHNFYRRAHLFLLPSKLEGMPLSLLEAQSCGLPAVGSNISGISELISEKNGALASVNDADGFVNAIRKYYDLWRFLPNEYRLLNNAIRESIVNNYDWAILTSKFEKMLEQCVNAL